MTPNRKLLLGAVLAMACATANVSASAQNLQTAGSLVVVPATGELTVPNDQAQVTLQVEEQDKDKEKAASRVNLKMKQGIDLLKRQDPQAVLKSHGYYTYAVYAEPQQNARVSVKERPIVGWRVGQYLDLTTQNLASLPKTVAAAQSLLNLNGLQFGLSPAATKKLDASLFDATYKNLQERVGFISGSMGRSATDASMETLDFEGSGNYAGNERAMPKTMAMMRSDMPAEPSSVAEPSFEPGESTVSMRLVAKIRFK